MRLSNIFFNPILNYIQAGLFGTLNGLMTASMVPAVLSVPPIMKYMIERFSVILFSYNLYSLSAYWIV